jgi:hypothetical protein
MPWDRFDRQAVGDAEVIVLANVPRVTDERLSILKEYLVRGGGLLMALGDRVDAAEYNRTLLDAESGVLSASLEEVKNNEFDDVSAVHVLDDSLEIPWMARFRSDSGGGLSQARFRQWWKISIDSANQPAKPLNDGTMADERVPVRATPVTLARLDTGDPLLLSGPYGRGGVMLLAVPLDADWSTLPARPDYVSLLHELIFHLGTGTTSRNVDVGTPLMLPVDRGFSAEKFAFYGPGGSSFPAKAAGDDVNPVVMLDDTRLPGIYTLRPKDEPQPVAQHGPPERFVVNFDRHESDLTRLSTSERTALQLHDRMAFVRSWDEIRRRSFAAGAATELWRWMLFLFVAILAAELLLTRSLVKGGHTPQGADDRAAGTRAPIREPVGAAGGS